VRKRPDLTRRHELEQFLSWLLGKHPQTEITGTATGRSLRRSNTWCWDIEPRLGPASTTHHQILIDGLWVGSWCLLIAVTETLEVLAWQWCARESTAAWTALLERLPAPAVVVCDGGAGIASAVHRAWPATRTQRCLFHVQMNIRRHLTLNPRTDAGRRLLGLSRELSTVRDQDAVIAWRLKLEAWWQAHGHLTKERSCGNARTTSPLEGGINNGIRTVLRNHRGMMCFVNLKSAI